MKKKDDNHELFQFLVDKGSIKQKVYTNTLDTINLIKKVLTELVNEYNDDGIKPEFQIPFEYKDKGEFEAELKFSGDVLIFMMHTNVFEFPKDHFIQNTSYVKDDQSRSFCGIINIFNFLGDSLKYRRINDVGYLIGRVFVNIDKHFYIDGKRELRLLPNNFADSVINEKKVKEIIESAIRYTIGFDLLVPPYDQIKEIKVHEILSTLDAMTIKTGKRLGFKFQADIDDLDK